LRLLNFARAELVDLPSLKKAIADGIVSCYVTDFPNEDMLGVEGIIPIPHLGASTPESEDNCATMAAAQLREFLLYGNIKNSVNFPACELPYAGKKRVCVMHRDVLDAVTAVFDGKIAGKAAAAKKGFAYAIIDTDGDAEAIAAKLEKTDGVIKVRVI
jgi:D-3-phosphoglycerate dehydrogenase